MGGLEASQECERGACVGLRGTAAGSGHKGRAGVCPRGGTGPEAAGGGGGDQGRSSVSWNPGQVQIEEVTARSPRKVS